jgi:hypothetical protein
MQVNNKLGRSTRHAHTTHHHDSGSGAVRSPCRFLLQDHTGRSRATPSFSIPVDMPVKDLGEIQLIAATPKRVSLGKDKDCTITATALPNDILRISLVYESSNERVDGIAADSYTERSTFLLPRGHRCAPKMGKQLMVVMRPVLITQ